MLLVVEGVWNEDVVCGTGQGSSNGVGNITGGCN